ncbi:hypothetical protein [Actinospica sp.]|uniref:hypothetical protein n=1 Tax=Actinospica sp. TaxID=1872142 RepID=UPI002CD37D8E|nr:hypothetical protein [Actinospica sp.]HWG24043.1 hypothetical protein [Actinospica sp.]
MPLEAITPGADAVLLEAMAGTDEVLVGPPHAPLAVVCADGAAEAIPVVSYKAPATPRTPVPKTAPASSFRRPITGPFSLCDIFLHPFDTGQHLNPDRHFGIGQRCRRIRPVAITGI